MPRHTDLSSILIMGAALVLTGCSAEPEPTTYYKLTLSGGPECLAAATALDERVREGPYYPDRPRIVFGPIPQERLDSAEKFLRSLSCGGSLQREPDENAVYKAVD